MKTADDRTRASGRELDGAGAGGESRPARLDPRWRALFSTAELRELHEQNAFRASLSVALNWALIGAALTMVAMSPNPASIVVAVFIIGGRQLGLAVLMHEASHRTLFKKLQVNDWVGNWLCAYPVWADLEPYRPYHLEHHAKLWTDEDPDLSLVLPFPITRDSLYRKIWRDLSGQTGLKRAVATLRRDLSISEGKVRRLGGDGLTFHNLIGVATTNLLLFGLLAACGWPSLYLVWIVAWFTTYSLSMRIRSISEHAMIPDPASVFTNSRTTVASWWERILLAPNRVNYHLEHHLLMRVPHYRLPRFHRMLRSRGALEGACVSKGYLATLSLASSKPASAR